MAEPALEIVPKPLTLILAVQDLDLHCREGALGEQKLAQFQTVDFFAAHAPICYQQRFASYHRYAIFVGQAVTKLIQFLIPDGVDGDQMQGDAADYIVQPLIETVQIGQDSAQIEQNEPLLLLAPWASSAAYAHIAHSYSTLHCHLLYLLMVPAEQLFEGAPDQLWAYLAGLYLEGEAVGQDLLPEPADLCCQCFYLCFFALKVEQHDGALLFIPSLVFLDYSVPAGGTEVQQCQHGPVPVHSVHLLVVYPAHPDRPQFFAEFINEPINSGLFHPVAGQGELNGFGVDYMLIVGEYFCVELAQRGHSEAFGEMGSPQLYCA